MEIIEFKDYPNTETPLNAHNLNRMQTNIKENITSTKTTSGETLTIEDACHVNSKLDISGNSEQETRSGKNFYKGFDYNSTRSGVEFNYYKDGSISAIGTATSAAYSMLSANATNYLFTLKAGTYILSGGTENIEVALILTNGDSKVSTNNPITFNIDEECSAFLRLNIAQR